MLVAERGVLAGLAVVAVIVGGIVWAVLSSSAPPDGPVPVAWDATRCTRCRMLLSEPGFAGQLHTKEGRVFFFDDPGCLLLYVSEQHPDVHAIWLHHHRDDRWISREQVVFGEVGASPMGYGLAAFERGEIPDGLAWQAARSQAAEREAARQARGSGESVPTDLAPGGRP